MKNPDRYSRKSYAMRRMTLAIERAIKRPSSKDKERAARWAAAWGLLCGIRTEGVNLREADVQSLERRIDPTADRIGMLASFSSHTDGSAEERMAPQNLPSAFPPATHALTALNADTPAPPNPA